MTNHLSIRKAAEHLGVSEALLFKRWRRGDGPPRVRIGKRVVLPVDGLEQWLTAEQETS